jgi:ferredoxin
VRTCRSVHLPSCPPCSIFSRPAHAALPAALFSQGDLYVDGTCIDCDTCRWMAPHTFDRVGGFSAVVAQPDNEAARMRALQAAVACPTGEMIKVVGSCACLTQQCMPAPRHGKTLRVR